MDKPLVDLSNLDNTDRQDKYFRQIDKATEQVGKELSKAPKKVEFKPIEVKPIEVQAEAPEFNPLEQEHSFIESHGYLKSFFEIDSMGFEEGEKLRTIWGYLSEKFPKALLQERLHQLRKMEQKMGQPKLGQSRLGRLHDYIHAQKMVEDAERWRDGVMGKK